MEIRWRTAGDKDLRFKRNPGNEVMEYFITVKATESEYVTRKTRLSEERENEGFKEIKTIRGKVPIHMEKLSRPRQL